MPAQKAPVPSSPEQMLLDRAEAAIGQARKIGAEHADVIVVSSTSLGVNVRLGVLEEIERSESTDLGLRVIIDQGQAIVSSTDLSDHALQSLAERAVAMARQAPKDPHCGLVAPELLARNIAALDLCDTLEPSTQTLVDMAQACESAGRSVAGITNSEGGSAGYGRSQICLMTSHGFAGSYAGTHSSLSCALVAGEGQGMERDYAFTSRRHMSDLSGPEAIGREAAKRTLARLNPRKVPSAKVPVVFDPRIGNSLIGHLAGAISGPAIARGTSFLTRHMGKPLFGPGIRVVDDPQRPRGMRSKPFDGEGVTTRKHDVVEDGHLRSWLLDRASAHQLGLTTTGHASRGTGGPPSPSPTNFYLGAGQMSAEELIGDIEEGFYVSELIGMGVNTVTGDYSRGAAGFWIEKGRLSYPVSEVTIAGNLLDMYRNLTPANDLEFLYGMDVPTIRIAEMTIAGT